MAWVANGGAGDELYLAVLYDPQTSGGLLVALPEPAANAFVADMQARGHGVTAVIGRIVPKPADLEEGRVTVVNAELSNFVGSEGGIAMSKPSEKAPTPVGDGAKEAAPASCCEHPPGEPCCENPPAADAGEDESAATLALFTDFMKAANKPGLIDRRTKKLMAIVLSISQRCRPCLKAHMQGAFGMGISKAEIDEAANLAISFGGCTAMMFYSDMCDELGCGQA